MWSSLFVSFKTKFYTDSDIITHVKIVEQNNKWCTIETVDLAIYREQFPLEYHLKSIVTEPIE